MNINGLVSEFSQYVQGELNATTIGFLHSITKCNEQGLQKLIHKLQQLQLELQAYQVHLVIQALTEQLNLPNDCYNEIQVFLQDPKRKNVMNTLHVLSKDNDSRLIQSVLHVIDNLNIFSETTPEHQLLRHILTIMMQWHTDSTDQRSSKDAARWLKTILGIPRKSSMGQIIQLLGDHIFLSANTIVGRSRNMDCLELFLLFEALASGNTLPTLSPNNKKLINDLHAATLTMVICQHSPYAFYDVVALHETHPHYAMIPSDHVEANHPHLDNFFNNPNGFTSYFKLRKQNHISNRQTFLWSLISSIDSLVLSQRLEAIGQFLTLAHQPLMCSDTKLFITWFKLSSLIQMQLLQSVYQTIVAKKTLNGGRIRAATLQLLAMRISPRSAFTMNNGTFQPLVNTEITTLDAMNTQSMLLFFIQTPAAHRTEFIQEILELAMRYRRTLITAQHIDNTVVSKSTALQVFQPTNSVHTLIKTTTPTLIQPNSQHRDRLFYRHPTRETEINSIGLSRETSERTRQSGRSH